MLASWWSFSCGGWALLLLSLYHGGNVCFFYYGVFFKVKRDFCAVIYVVVAECRGLLFESADFF
jgi:hypothetical protein